MAKSGWPAGNPLNEDSVQDANEAFNDAERFKIGWTYDWSYSAFIVYNPPPASLFFTDGQQAWAFYGGPWTDVLFDSGGWGLYNLGRVLTHETGHIFWACDEYAGTFNCGNCNATCRAFGPRLAARNGNCVSCNASSQLCMMRGSDSALCNFTPAQIGW